MNRTLFAALATTALFALTPTSSGQCFGPDGLDVGGCCAPAQAILPQFPQAALPGLGICWNSCNVSAQTDLRVNWAPPASPSCAQYTTTVTVTHAGSGMPLLGGLMVLDYTRTWIEANPVTGQLIQVWRFVAKADLSSLVPTGVTPPCPVPTCLPPFGPHPTAFYYGYVDYAQDCGVLTGFQNTLVLFHGCDFLQHKPGLSSRPGVFHPTTTYAIVAPHSSLNPFVPANLPAPGGPLIAEAVRKISLPGTVACMTEERIAHGDLLPFVTGCLCPPAALPPQFTLSIYRGVGTCPDAAGLPSSFDSLAVAFPTLPWFHLTTISIGFWSSAAAYPGEEVVWVDEGLFKYYDSCVSNRFYEVNYGATTDRGWTVIPTNPTIPPSQRFKDLADNYSAPVVGAHPLPLLGNIMPTDHLIYTNVP